MGGGRVRKIPFYGKRSFSLRDSWKVTSDVNVIVIHATKPRGRSAKNSSARRGKIKSSMKDDGTRKNN